MQLGALLVAILALGVAMLPGASSGSTRALVEWARQAGAPGACAFVALFAMATVALVPGVVLTVAAGAIYGPMGGALLVCPGSVLGATLAFSCGRWVARERVERRVRKDARFAAVDAAVGAHGARIVLLLRLSPVLPFGLLNYALGLTSIRLRDYVVASAVGMLPGTLLYTYVGSAAARAAQPDGADVLSRAATWGGLLATIVVVVLIARVTRRALALSRAAGVGSS